MKTALITGSSGLVGSEASKFFAEKDFKIVGVDNDMRAYFFGKVASTQEIRKQLERNLKDRYVHYSIDVRDRQRTEKIFKKYSFDVIIHAAAQPSHDWAAKEPLTDFGINASGTLILLENFRQYSPDAVFIFTSTNKVYGDAPNRLPLVELESRWELPQDHPFFKGIDESMSVDYCLHSLFGASKASADILVQEYGRYFNLKTGSFRCGCITGPLHKSAEPHGFLVYLAKCIALGNQYTIYGYKSKQVRDNIHSYDLVNAFWHFYKNPKGGEVYNMGGSRHSNLSMKEAISSFEKALNKKAKIVYTEQNRKGDHIWYISNIGKFRSHYPEWKYAYDVNAIIEEICAKGKF